jgi:hypothetical protein
MRSSAAFQHSGGLPGTVCSLRKMTLAFRTPAPGGEEPWPGSYPVITRTPFLSRSGIQLFPEVRTNPNPTPLVAGLGSSVAKLLLTAQSPVTGAPSGGPRSASVHALSFPVSRPLMDLPFSLQAL